MRREGMFILLRIAAMSVRVEVGMVLGNWPGLYSRLSRSYS